MSLQPPLWRDRHEAGLGLAHRLCTGSRSPLASTGIGQHEPLRTPDDLHAPGVAAPREAQNAGVEGSGEKTAGAQNSLLLALPHGGVVVAAAMAELLPWPVLPWSVRKIVDPQWPELALGAIAPGGITVWRQGLDPRLRQRALDSGWVLLQERELQRRRELYGDPSPELLSGHPLIVVDDGIATGMTVQAALRSLRALRPPSLTLAVPVLDRSVLEDLLPLLDHLEALAVVDDLRSVGKWYQHFEQVSDGEVLALLARQAHTVP